MTIDRFGEYCFNQCAVEIPVSPAPMMQTSYSEEVGAGGVEVRGRCLSQNEEEEEVVSISSAERSGED